MLTALIVAAFGIILLYLTNSSSIFPPNSPAQIVLRELGALCIASVALVVIWELSIKRAFVDELLIKSRISVQLQEAGILQVVYNPHSVDWEQLFETSHQIDIHFMYGRNWRGTHKRRIIDFLDRPNARLCVILPDPDNEVVINGLVARMEMDAEIIRSRIQEAVNDFLSLANGKDNVEIWLTSAQPAHAFFCFDSIGILSPYSYQPHDTGTGVPHFIVGKGGSVFGFIRAEYKSLIDKHRGLSRKIT